MRGAPDGVWIAGRAFLAHRRDERWRGCGELRHDTAEQRGATRAADRADLLDGRHVDRPRGSRRGGWFVERHRDFAWRQPATEHLDHLLLVERLDGEVLHAAFETPATNFLPRL